jgi:hypothetical protein
MHSFRSANIFWINLVKRNQQLYYHLQRMSIMLLFLLVKKSFGFENYWQSLKFHRINPLLFGVIIRVSFTSLATMLSTKGQITLRFTCTSFDSSSKMVFFTWSIGLLKSRLLTSSLNLWHPLVFFSYNRCFGWRKLSLGGHLESSYLHFFLWCILLFGEEIFPTGFSPFL